MAKQVIDTEVLPEHDRLRLKLIQAKSLLGLAEVDLNIYRWVEGIFVKRFPEFGTKEGRLRVSRAWYFQRQDEEVINLLYQLAQEEFEKHFVA